MVKFGPRCDLKDHYFHRMGCSPEHKEAEMCGACHWWEPKGVPVFTEYADWKAGPAREGKPCQDCHMPKDEGRDRDGLAGAHRRAASRPARHGGRSAANARSRSRSRRSSDGTARRRDRADATAARATPCRRGCPSAGSSCACGSSMQAGAERRHARRGSSAACSSTRAATKFRSGARRRSARDTRIAARRDVADDVRARRRRDRRGRRRLSRLPMPSRSSSRHRRRGTHADASRS